MSSILNQIRNGVVFSFTSLICFGVAYAAISWPSSPPTGETAGGKYASKLVPTGFVGAFELSACPTGWSAADGTNGHADLRGTFIRGIGGDANGRDVVRSLLSYQADELKSHNHNMQGHLATISPNSPPSPILILDGAQDLYTSSVGGSETRPRNVALLYCVKN